MELKTHIFWKMVFEELLDGEPASVLSMFSYSLGYEKWA